eukprot:Skav203002  [mRNA]  locus=scaffold1344:167356:172612:+ [translate_table: standard]
MNGRRTGIEIHDSWLICSQRWQEFKDSDALAETQADAAERLMHKIDGAQRPDEAWSNASWIEPKVSEVAGSADNPPAAAKDLSSVVKKPIVRDTSIWDTDENKINAEIREPHFNPLKDKGGKEQKGDEASKILDSWPCTVLIKHGLQNPLFLLILPPALVPRRWPWRIAKASGMTELCVVASCPEVHHDAVKKICDKMKIVKAFGKMGDMVDDLPGDWVPKWQMRVVASVTTSLQLNPDCSTVKAYLIQGGPHCNAEYAAMPKLKEAVEKELKRKVRMPVSWMSFEEFEEMMSSLTA